MGLRFLCLNEVELHIVLDITCLYRKITLRLSDLNLDFSLIFESYENIRKHTMQVMADREKYIKEKYDNNIK